MRARAKSIPGIGEKARRIRADLLLLMVSSCLYFLNQQIKMDVEPAWLYGFMNGYFNDVVCGAAFTAYCDVFVTLWRGPIRKLAVIEGMLLGCGLFWELAVPLFLADSVGDPLDILAYLFGGLIYWILMGDPAVAHAGDRNTARTAGESSRRNVKGEEDAEDRETGQ